MSVTLDDKYTLARGRAYLTGIEALVRLPMLQRQRDLARGLNTAGFISGYRGSPLGGLDNALWRAADHLKQHHIHFQPGVNEELAATALWGSQQINLFPGARYDGVFGLWYGKGPGLDRAMDALKHANNAGSAEFGGVLVVVGDDHLCKSSTLAFQSEPMFIAASVPVLNPAGVQDVLDLGIVGWELSRYSGCWVGFKTTPENMDAAISATLDPDRVRVILPAGSGSPMAGLNIRWPDAPLDQEQRLQRDKLAAVLAFAWANRLDRVVIDSPQPRLGIVTVGKSHLDTLEALDELGVTKEVAAELGLRVYKVAMSWPLEPEGVREFAAGLDEILVIEEKRSLIEDQIKSQFYHLPADARPRVVGKFDDAGAPLLSNAGELTPEQIATAVVARLRNTRYAEHLQQHLDRLVERQAGPSHPVTLKRQPWYCAGCPHNTSTKVPEGSRALAGIGCHYMVTWMDRNTETFTQMGGEGASWIGQAPFTSTPHVFQNLGDGTYFHSGILAIRAAIAAGVNITYKILYNDAVAMTGGQHVDGSLTVEQLALQLRGEGVKRIAVVSDAPEKYGAGFPRFEGLSIDHRDDFDALQRALRDIEGTTVIIYEQTCATEKRRRRKRGELVDPARRVFINKEVCEGCGDCGVQSNCLAVVPKETELGRKRAIDQSACNKDFSCLKGFCPSFVTVEGGGLRRNAATADTEAVFPPLPDPVVPVISEPYNILLTGVGGMGVLTVGSVVGMAAHIEGKGAAVLTQTGLAQKFGAVTSHVRIAQRQEDIHSARVAVASGHLLLGADLVVSSGSDALVRMSGSQGHAVVNNHDSPTADFTHNPDAPFPEPAMTAAISAAVGDERAAFFDATSLGTALLGDAIASNFLLLGYAWQKGLVPVGEPALLESIRLNAVQVDFNLKAFQWGRRYAEFPELVAQCAGLGEPQPDDGAIEILEDLVADRRERLIAYQSRRYAERYMELVTSVRRREAELGLAGSALAEAVARNYFKLLAYKDEYEVARLYTDGRFQRELARQFDGDYKLHFHLAPPLLSKRDPHTGHLIKREFGPWIFPLFTVLAKLRFLRGTPFDIMGRTQERRMERDLILGYEHQIDEVLSRLTPANHGLAVELAGLPFFIRGFGHVKEANVNTVSRRAESLLAKLRNQPQRSVHIHHVDEFSE